LQNGERSKLDSKSRKCIFLGSDTSIKGYKLWDPVSKKKIISRDVLFDKAYMLGKYKDEISIDNQKRKQFVEVELQDQSSPMNKSDNEQFSRDSKH
jgi:hypothetical protein